MAASSRSGAGSLPSSTISGATAPRASRARSRPTRSAAGIRPRQSAKPRDVDEGTSPPFGSASHTRLSTSPTTATTPPARSTGPSALRVASEAPLKRVTSNQASAPAIAI